MSQRSIVELIKRISGQANILTIPRPYIDLTGGDIEAALFLSQCVYWSDKGGNAAGFWKSANEWHAEIGLTYYKLKRATAVCAKWVSTRLKRANGAPTIHYKVDLEVLADDLTAILEKSDFQETSKSDFQETLKSDIQETSKSLTETTHKPQTETTEVNAPRKRGRAPRQPATPKERDARLDAPIIKAILEIDRRYPAKTSWDSIIGLFPAEIDVERLRRVVLAWRSVQGRNPHNWQAMAEWYGQGIPTNGKPQAGRGDKRAAAWAALQALGDDNGD